MDTTAEDTVNVLHYLSGDPLIKEQDTALMLITTHLKHSISHNLLTGNYTFQRNVIRMSFGTLDSADMLSKMCRYAATHYEDAVYEKVAKDIQWSLPSTVTGVSIYPNFSWIIVEISLHTSP